MIVAQVRRSETLARSALSLSDMPSQNVLNVIQSTEPGSCRQSYWFGKAGTPWMQTKRQSLKYSFICGCQVVCTLLCDSLLRFWSVRLRINSFERKIQCQERGSQKCLYLYMIVSVQWQGVYLSIMHLLIIIGQMMMNRLVAENTIKVVGVESGISSNRHILAYKAKGQLRVRLLHKEYHEIDLLPTTTIAQFQVGATHNIVYVLTHSAQLLIFNLDQQPLQYTIDHVDKYTECGHTLIVQFTNSIIRALPLLPPYNEAHAVGFAQENAIWIGGQHKIFISTQQQISVYQNCTAWGSPSHNVPPKLLLTLPPLQDIIGVFEDRFIFTLDSSSFYATDIEQGVRYGPIAYSGRYRHARIIHNLLILVTNFQNTDNYNFYVLTEDGSLISHFQCYEKGKADSYAIINEQHGVADALIQKKLCDRDTVWVEAKASAHATSTLIFVMFTNKEKTEMIKLDHSKLYKNPFNEIIDKTRVSIGSQKQNSIRDVSSSSGISSVNKSYNHVSVNNISSAINIELENNIQIEREKIKIATQANSLGNITDTQGKFIELLIDKKMKEIMVKFTKLEQRVDSLQRTIRGVYKRIDASIEKINREEIKKSIETLFVEVTPHFEQYFQEIFRQVANVMEQGVSYYNMKLSREAQIHEEALAKIVKETFKSTEEIIELSTQDSQRAKEALIKLREAKKRWNMTTKECEDSCKETGRAAEGKIFTKADIKRTRRRQDEKSP